MSDLPLEPLVDEFLYFELKMTASVLWVGGDRFWDVQLSLGPAD